MKSKNIVCLDYRVKEQRDAAVQLHSELLPESPIRLLGRFFMAKFYYNKLVKDGLVSCDLYKYNDKFVGLLSYTKYPSSFMRNGRNRNFIYLICILIISIMARPWRVAVLLDILKVSSRRRRLDEGGVAEFLSFGVLKPYRHIIDEESGLRIADLLFLNRISFFKKEGYKKVILSIIKKEDNEGIFTFYKFYGTSFTKDTRKETGFDNAFMGIYDLTRENQRVEQAI